MWNNSESDTGDGLANVNKDDKPIYTEPTEQFEDIKLSDYKCSNLGSGSDKPSRKNFRESKARDFQRF